MIPKNWTQTTLDEVAKWGSGGTPSRKKSEYFQGDIPWIKTGELGSKYVFDAEEKITEEAIANSSAKVFQKGSVGIAMYGATIGKLSIWGIDASTNQACAVGLPTPDLLDNEFLYYYLASQKRELIKEGKGGAQPNISQGLLKSWPILLPPINEQKRIVAKIEELFAELDAGVASLQLAQTQLKTYRQSLLKHAFEGKLTAQWRAQNADKLEPATTLLQRIKAERQTRHEAELAAWKAAVKTWEANGKPGKKPRKPRPLKNLPPLTPSELADLPKLPVGWSWVKIHWFLSLEKKPMSTGPFGTMLKKSEHQPSGIPVLGIENIGNGKFVPGNKIFVTKSKAQELESFRLEVGDVIISRSGTVGEICKVPEGWDNSLISTNLIRVSLNNSAMNEDFFVYLFQGGGHVMQQVKDLCKGSSREFLNQTILLSIIFPLPNPIEQQQVVSEIESCLSIADQLELTITDGLQQAESLRQSILKKAFAGQLVAQDPQDEPASALLSRIQAAKEAAAQAAKNQKKTNKKSTRRKAKA